MITHLQGRLARMDAATPAVEIEVAGVRYEVLVPLVLWPELQVISDAADGDAELGLDIFYYATANQPVPILVGFLRRAERDFFRKFITVEGIGPAKAARAMNVSVSTIARAIEQEDRATLTRLPGIGVRAADKIIATLRGKVLAEAAMADGRIAEPVDASKLEHEHVALDALDSLVALGYQRSEARRWVEEVIAEMGGQGTLEEVTLAVLRRQGR